MKFSKITRSADKKNMIKCDELSQDFLIRKLPDEIVDKRAFMLKDRTICNFI